MVVVFYPFTFTGGCTGELRDDLAAYQRADAQVLAVSCDSPFAQAKFAAEQGNVASTFSSPDLKTLG